MYLLHRKRSFFILALKLIAGGEILYVIMLEC
jgi:hypothetical protein